MSFCFRRLRATRSGGRHTAVFVFFATLFAAFPPTWGADAPPPTPPARPAAPRPPSGANALTQAAVQNGMLGCADRIEQVSGFLGFGRDAGALLMLPPAQPDQHLISLAMEAPTEVGSAYVSASFAPNQANGCGASYDAVVYWPAKCGAVAAKQFAALKRVGPLKRDIVVLDGGRMTKVFLMPAGSGCVSIKKELVQ